jgi:type I restriction enzyme, S subunit
MKPLKMKDSGIEWIGEIPEGWSPTKIKYDFQVNAEKLGENTADDFKFEYIDISSVNDLGKIISPPIMEFQEAPSRARMVVRKGDVIISTVRTYLRAIAQIDESNRYVCSTGFAVLRPRSDVNSRFAFYQMQSESIIQSIVSRSVGVSYPAISPTELAATRILHPHIEEQTRIASHLDEKCGEIDRVIAAKERQNELLRDQRAAIIHEAVTKGIDPKAKFKESGIEWIGKVPHDWTLDKVKWLGKCIIGLTYSPEDVADEGTLVMRSSNVQGGKIVYDDNVYVKKDIPEELVLRKNDILICSRNGSRALIGKCALIDEKAQGHTFGAFMTVLRSASNRYLFYVLNSRLFSFYLGAFLTSTINQLTTENLNNMVVPIPKSVDEQEKISVFLDTRCGEIDRVMEANAEMIAKLKTYRSSLIWEAVTGKVDV